MFFLKEERGKIPRPFKSLLELYKYEKTTIFNIPDFAQQDQGYHYQIRFEE